MSMCDRCIHNKVCGSEGTFDPAMTYCSDFMGWIPVSERMPMHNQCVLTYRPNMAVKILTDEYVGYYGDDDFEWHEYWVHAGDNRVTAWMPLPEPYKAESEDKG